MKRLRALPVGSLNETTLADAFVKTHSQAEVYRLQAMETVFGPLEGMDPSTLASLMQTMRTNLGTVWRAPKVQQDAKTNRTDKDIQAEITRCPGGCDGDIGGGAGGQADGKGGAPSLVCLR